MIQAFCVVVFVCLFFWFVGDFLCFFLVLDVVEFSLGVGWGVGVFFKVILVS